MAQRNHQDMEQWAGIFAAGPSLVSCLVNLPLEHNDIVRQLKRRESCLKSFLFRTKTVNLEDFRMPFLKQQTSKNNSYLLLINAESKIV